MLDGICIKHKRTIRNIGHQNERSFPIEAWKALDPTKAMACDENEDNVQGQLEQMMENIKVQFKNMQENFEAEIRKVQAKNLGMEKDATG